MQQYDNRSLKVVKENTKLEILLKGKDSASWLNLPGPGGKTRKQVLWIEALTRNFFKILTHFMDNGSFASFLLAGRVKSKFTTFRDLVFIF